MSFPKMNEIMDAVKENIGNPMESVIGKEGSAIQEAPAQAQAPDPAGTQAPGTPGKEITPEEQAIVDLKEVVKDKKFKFEDGEYSYDDLKKSVMRWKDYTKKTQEISAFKKEYEELKKDRQFLEALPGDLDRVKSNPELAARFKEVYPEKYHQYVAQYAAQAAAEQPLTEDRIKQIVQGVINPVVKPLQESITAENAKSIVAQMEAWDAELGSKFKDADIKHVYTILEAAKAEGTPVTKELWEDAWKQSNDYFAGVVNARLQERFKEKQQLNNAAKDTKPGGAIPGQAPEKVPLKDVRSRITDYLKSANQ